jgi:hypothetical protein
MKSNKLSYSPGNLFSFQLIQSPFIFLELSSFSGCDFISIFLLYAYFIAVVPFLWYPAGIILSINNLSLLYLNLSLLNWILIDLIPSHLVVFYHFEKNVTTKHTVCWKNELRYVHRQISLGTSNPFDQFLVHLILWISLLILEPKNEMHFRVQNQNISSEKCC